MNGILMSSLLGKLNRELLVINGWEIVRNYHWKLEWKLIKTRIFEKTGWRVKTFKKLVRIFMIRSKVFSSEAWCRFVIQKRVSIHQNQNQSNLHKHYSQLSQHLFFNQLFCHFSSKCWRMKLKISPTLILVSCFFFIIN